jgi:hypothetical protein
MEQRARQRPHFERALFICGDQNAGKSHLLREMFVDARLGTRGVRPSQSKIRPVPLGNQRCLFVRCTSPHERGETLALYIRKVDRSMAHAFKTHWRFNFACALQPGAANNMPDIVDTCERFVADFRPERVRIMQINPTHDGSAPATPLTTAQIDRLRKAGVEFCTIDARKHHSLTPNGLLLADFFDFT